MGLFDKLTNKSFELNQADYTKPINIFIECSGFNDADFNSHFEGNKLFINAEKNIVGYKTLKFNKSFDVDKNYYDISKTEIAVVDGLMNIFIPLNEQYKGTINVKKKD